MYTDIIFTQLYTSITKYQDGCWLVMILHDVMMNMTLNRNQQKSNVEFFGTFDFLFASLLLRLCRSFYLETGFSCLRFGDKDNASFPLHSRQGVGIYIRDFPFLRLTVSCSSRGEGRGGIFCRWLCIERTFHSVIKR